MNAMHGARSPQEDRLSWSEEKIFRNFVLAPEDLGVGIARLAVEDALALPLLNEDLRLYLLRESVSLPYRPARPTVGAKDRPVYQDFELCMTFEEDNPFRMFANALDRLTALALPFSDIVLSPKFTFNDLIVQRYTPGSKGISPHRDHIRYEELVALVILAGDADFSVCRDRDGTDTRLVPSPEGSVLLMRGARFAGRTERPFHMLQNIRSFRVSFGLRFDTRPGDPL